jgi:hypothetical protein
MKRHNESDDESNFHESRFPKDARRQKILTSFNANNRELNDRIVFELADIELKSREDTGQSITESYLRGNLDREVCIARLKEQGYNLWWGSEALWYIIKVEKYSLTRQTPESSLLVADCIMEYVGGRSPLNKMLAKNQRSKISIIFDEDLVSKEFLFEWLK